MSHGTVQFTELTRWMKRNSRGLRGFAAEIGHDKMKLSRLIHGQISALDLQLMADIERVTNGEIGARQFSAFRRRLVAAVTPQPGATA